MIEALEKFKSDKTIICIDIKCFFATAECKALNKDPMTTDLVVADASRQGGAIVLAISPSLKAKGIKNRCRLFELPKNMKIDIIKPRMSYYIEESNNILKMYLEYFSSEDILVYSIDEVFIDITSYLKLYETDAYSLTKMLLDRLRNDLRLPAAAGIGNNMLLAKFALDIEAKHQKDSIAMWNYENIKEKLWPITDLKDVWGIGRGLENRLNQLGIESMYDLAHYDVYKLVRHLGVVGEELFLHAHGIDISVIQDQKASERKGYSIGQTLFKDTSKEDVLLILQELVFQVCERLRDDGKVASTFRFWIGYARDENQVPFSIQHKFSESTFNPNDIFEWLIPVYQKNVIDIKIRRLGIACNHISDFSGVQLNLFSKPRDEFSSELAYATDLLNAKYGNTTIVKASALKKGSTLLQRKKLIGGHNAK